MLTRLVLTTIALLAAARLKSVRAVCILASSTSAGKKATHFLGRAQQTELEQTGRIAFTSRGRSLELSKDFFADADTYDMLKVKEEKPLRSCGAP